MRKSNSQTLKDAIETMIDSYRIRGKMNRVKVMNSWEIVVGKVVDNHTTNTEMRNGVLFVTLDSPVIRTELSYRKTVIIADLNTLVGDNVVVDIVFR